MTKRVKLDSLGVALLLVSALAGCAGPSDRGRVDPAAARYSIAALLPAHVTDPQGWAEDIYVALEALDIRPSAQNICAVVAVTDQESSFAAQPVVPGLGKIALKEIESRAAQYRIPRIAVRGALALPSGDGETFGERLSRVRTEKELSDLYADLIGRVPLGGRLFGGLNPVRTGGPMQVSIAFAEDHARSTRYPLSRPTDVREEVFSRQGGMYFGIAHLLDYPVSYDRMLFRFADFNAGHYASRNAAFQRAVSALAKTKLVLDGDLILYGDNASGTSQTELAVRQLASRIDLTHEDIHADLLASNTLDFEDTRTYQRVFALADESGRTTPRAIVPTIRLQSAKITRNLTTEWFANRVDTRYRSCLERGSS